MSDNSSIEWCDASWSPITGCTRVSSGCDHCYSAALSKRLAAMGQKKYQGIVGNGHFNGVVKTWDDELSKPLKWRKPKMIFVNSMSDTFHKDVRLEFLCRMFAVMYECHWHTFQVLTKRPERMSEVLLRGDVARAVAYAAYAEMLLRNPDREIVSVRDVISDVEANWPLPNVWCGTSVEDQQRADERIPWLLKCPAAIRFLSCEPLIGPVDLSTHLGIAANHDDLRGKLHWIICGGESGHGARPCNVRWIRDIRDQCKAAGVPCFIKQLGGMPCDDGMQPAGGWWKDQRRTWEDFIDGQNMFGRYLKDKKGGDINEWPEDLRVRQFPTTAVPQ